MDVIKEALEFEQQKLVLNSRDERIKLSIKLKKLILDINEVYKKDKDPSVMELMKRLTVIKRKVESRLKGRLTSS